MREALRQMEAYILLWPCEKLWLFKEPLRVHAAIAREVGVSWQNLLPIAANWAFFLRALCKDTVELCLYHTKDFFPSVIGRHRHRFSVQSFLDSDHSIAIPHLSDKNTKRISIYTAETEPPVTRAHAYIAGFHQKSKSFLISNRATIPRIFSLTKRLIKTIMPLMKKWSISKSLARELTRVLLQLIKGLWSHVWSVPV